MGRLDRPGGVEVQNFKSGVGKIENFVSGVGKISKIFGAKFEFSKKILQNRIFSGKNDFFLPFFGRKQSIFDQKYRKIPQIFKSGV